MTEPQTVKTIVTDSECSTSERLPGVKAEIVKQMLAASDEMDLEKSLQFCTDDVTYQFGNFPVVSGKQGIRTSFSGFLPNFKALKHDIQAIWEIGDTAVVALEVTYTRQDDKMFTLPCCNIIRIQDDLIQDLQIYMDISPVFTR